MIFMMKQHPFFIENLDYPPFFRCERNGGCAILIER